MNTRAEFQIALHIPILQIVMLWSAQMITFMFVILSQRQQTKDTGAYQGKAIGISSSLWSQKIC